MPTSNMENLNTPSYLDKTKTLSSDEMRDLIVETGIWTEFPDADADDYAAFMDRHQGLVTGQDDQLVEGKTSATGRARFGPVSTQRHAYLATTLSLRRCRPHG